MLETLATQSATLDFQGTVGTDNREQDLLLMRSPDYRQKVVSGA